MKNVFKKTFKIIIICFALILSSCEKELYEQSIIKNKSSKTEMLRGKEAEKVALRLKKILGSQNSLSSNEFARTISLNIGNISYDEILKIIDTYGKENYTLKIELPEETDLKFANLVLQEKDAYTTIKLIEYNMTEQFAQEFKQHKDITRFKGTIKFTPIFSDNPCPEPEVIVHVLDIPSNNASNTGNSGYIVPGSGGVSPATPGINIYFFLTLVTIQIPSYSGSGDNTGIGNIICPPSYHYDPAVRDCVPNTTVNKIQIYNPTVQPIESEQPCSPETEIGILIPLDDCSKDFLNELDDEQQAWMYQQQSNNASFYWEILNYVAEDESGCSTEKNRIAKKLLAEQKKGGKIDFENKIIIDSSFVANQKAMCVYNKMRNINAFNKALAPFETETPVAFLKLMTEDMGNNGRAVTEPPLDSLNIITIKINNNTISNDGINYQANLLLAQTIIHEVIHAELYRKIMIAIGNGSYSADPDVVRTALASSEFDVLSEYYRLGNDWPHSYMADHMRNTIARVTEEFATSLPITTPSQYYKTLAWRGLMHYGTVTSWTQIVGSNPSLPSSTAIDIEQTIYNYETTHANENCQ
jgi:hypothetical protein